MIRVGLLGYGVWGRNIARCLEATEGVRLVGVYDPMPGRPPSRLVHAGIFDDATIDAVVVATPASTHRELAERALRHGKHVLVAKPLAASVEDAEAMADAADVAGRVLMVDHTFAYSPAVIRAREIISEGRLGRLVSVDSTRVNLGAFQPDVDVVWDLAPHDLSILQELAPASLVASVATIASDPLGYGRASCAHLHMSLACGAHVHVHVDWLSPVKVRRTLVTGEARMLVYDDVEPDEKIRVYDARVDVDERERQVAYRTGDVWIPRVALGEALMGVCAEFRDAIVEERAPRTGAAEGVEVVRVLEAASESIRTGGGPVRVERPASEEDRLGGHRAAVKDWERAVTGAPTLESRERAVRALAASRKALKSELAAGPPSDLGAIVPAWIRGHSVDQDGARTGEEPRT